MKQIRVYDVWPCNCSANLSLVRPRIRPGADKMALARLRLLALCWEQSNHNLPASFNKCVQQNQACPDVEGVRASEDGVGEGPLARDAD